jgi:hypothetical protein
LIHSPVLPRPCQESEEERGILDNNDHEIVNSSEEETDNMNSGNDLCKIKVSEGAKLHEIFFAKNSALIL